MTGLSKKLLLCFCFCLGISTATAQYRFDHWMTDDGLPQNSVRRIVQTSDGYLWLTTLDDLVRFDGNLYAPTPNGLARFDGTGFTVVSTRKELAQSRSLFAASGTFWEINKDSLSVLRNGQKSVFDLPAAMKNEFSSDFDVNYWVRLFEERQGVLWISTQHSNESRSSSNELFKFADGKFAEIVFEGVPRSPTSNIAQDRSGTL